MGKKQHQSDKLYITHKEWSNLFGGKRPEIPGKSASFKRLPYDCCALSFQPFDVPVCTADGTIFDLSNIVPWVKKHKISPVTGEKLSLKHLIRLHFHKNGDGKYHCPVTYKVFTPASKIAAVKTTGNVYAYDAIHQFNIKAKNMHDLLTEEAFTTKDVIMLQDPNKLDKFNLTRFYHVKNQIKMDEEEQFKRRDPKYYLKGSSTDATAIMDELEKTKGQWESRKDLGSQLSSTKAATPDASHSSHFSTGEASRSFTSTHLTPRTVNTREAIDDDVVRYKKIKTKGYVQLKTSLGDINLELHCDLAPHTCENFLLHCKAGYYDGTIFHRSIKHFMIQGGDPTGTGSGGASAFPGGAAFKDEFRPQLTHKGRGILSMANSGKDTNKSQFFITYRSASHLDRKHSVFGKLVGGGETLTSMERIQTDDTNRPTEEIKILGTEVFVDPFEQLREKEASEKQAAEDEEQSKKRALDEKPQVFKAGVGKYLRPAGTGADPAKAAAAAAAAAADPFLEPRKKARVAPPKAKGGYGNFGSF